MKKITVVSIILIGSFAFSNLNATCVAGNAEVLRASKNLKNIYNFVFTEYLDVCSTKNVDDPKTSCTISKKKIDALKKDQIKLNKLIDYTYVRGVQVYKTCGIKSGFDAIDKIRNYDGIFLNENINDCMNRIEKSRKDTCPL